MWNLIFFYNKPIVFTLSLYLKNWRNEIFICITTSLWSNLQQHDWIHRIWFQADFPPFNKKLNINKFCRTTFIHSFSYSNEEFIFLQQNFQFEIKKKYFFFWEVETLWPYLWTSDTRHHDQPQPPTMVFLPVEPPHPPNDRKRIKNYYKCKSNKKFILPVALSKIYTLT